MSVYKRVLLKLSGEALSGAQGFGFDNNVLDSFISEIKEIHEQIGRAHV